jgi:hypothetical protein
MSKDTYIKGPVTGFRTPYDNDLSSSKQHIPAPMHTNNMETYKHKYPPIEGYHSSGPSTYPSCGNEKYIYPNRGSN